MKNLHTILPRILRSGDTIGVVSPSWDTASRFPHRVQAGIEALGLMGFKVQIGKSVFSRGNYIAGDAQCRADDINDFFKDPKIHGVICAIGGDHACELLPLLDYEVIKQNPKVFMGYSDVTVLNMAIWKQTGMITFNGPMVMMDFAEFPKVLNYTEEGFLRSVCSGIPIGRLKESEYWTEERLEWRDKHDRLRARRLNSTEGWRWIKEGQGKGVLVGGCIESLQHLRGTNYWPNWRNSVFFWEISSQKLGLAHIDSVLVDYENMGVLKEISGMLVGRAPQYSSEEKRQLEKIILNRTEKYNFPVVANMDFGHTSPQMTLPLGCTVVVDSDDHYVSIIDSCVSL